MNIKRIISLLLIALISIVIFVSCNTTKRAKPCSQCPSYTHVIPIVDTVTIPTIHHHIHEECICVWIPGETFVIADTIYLIDL